MLVRMARAVVPLAWRRAVSTNLKPMTKCERCGKLITLAPESSRHEDAHPFRLAKEPKGVCANCVMTQFLYNTYPINMQIDDSGPELLLNPAIREYFIRCGLLAHSDLNIDEVDWTEVVCHWKLPVKIQKSGMNPYRMGESPRAWSRPPLFSGSATRI